MTVTRNHGDFIFRCDGKDCRAFLETFTSNFTSALNMLRRHRWQPVKRAGNPRDDGAESEWLHHCSQCQRGGELFPNPSTRSLGNHAVSQTRGPS